MITENDLNAQQKANLKNSPKLESFDDAALANLFGPNSSGKAANTLAQRYPLVYQDLRQRARVMGLL